MQTNARSLHSIQAEIELLKEKREKCEREWNRIESQTKHWIPTKALRRKAESKIKAKTICFQPKN